jgi:dTDP-4-dehydrorhamnose reductase
MAGLAWITGAGGLIGSHLVRHAPSEWKVHALTRAEIDLTNSSAARTAFARERPQLIIHCAALSKTLECEQNPERARTNNVEVTRVLVGLAANIPLIFFSTDLVFDGAKGNYSEGDAPNPITVYAETKLVAEEIVLANPKHTVIRTSLNAGRTSNGTAFNEQWRAIWQRGEALNLFTDEFRSPLPAEITARAVWELVAANRPDLYHLAGGERLSRYDIGRLLAAQEPQLNARIEPGSIQNYTGMKRSPDTSLDCGKVQQLLSFPLPKFSEWLGANPGAFISRTDHDTSPG